MAADIRLLQGEIQTDPANREIDLDRMLTEFINALYREQFPAPTPIQGKTPPTAADLLSGSTTADPIEAFS